MGQGISDFFSYIHTESISLVISARSSATSCCPGKNKASIACQIWLTHKEAIVKIRKFSGYCIRTFALARTCFRELRISITPQLSWTVSFALHTRARVWDKKRDDVRLVATTSLCRSMSFECILHMHEEIMHDLQLYRKSDRYTFKMQVLEGNT